LQGFGLLVAIDKAAWRGIHALVQLLRVAKEQAEWGGTRMVLGLNWTSFLEILHR
jgi:hypothetical protein